MNHRYTPSTDTHSIDTPYETKPASAFSNESWCRSGEELFTAYIGTDLCGNSLGALPPWNNLKGSPVLINTPWPEHCLQWFDCLYGKGNNPNRIESKLMCIDACQTTTFQFQSALNCGVHKPILTDFNQYLIAIQLILKLSENCQKIF